MRACLLELERPVYAVEIDGRAGLTNEGEVTTDPAGAALMAFAPAQGPEALGDPVFRSTFRAKYALYAGAMANGIASVELVIALGKQGMLGSYGAGGVSPTRIESAIQKIQAELPEGNYFFNLLNSPNEPAVEQNTAELYLKHGIHAVEASAYLIPTSAVIQYRAAGLSQDPDGGIQIQNKLIAKLSRREVAQRFLEPASEEILKRLVVEGKISERQAVLARQVPMADAITVEADSGGHTDNRPLVSLIPALMAQRDRIQAQRNYPQPVMVGAGGGIGTPAAALAAFMMGAGYVVTGSINQACVESGASEHTRQLLAQAEMTDVSMAPAADMFEMGVKVQVLKRGTMFAMRAQKLYELYSRYPCWEEIPEAEREKLEKTVFKRSFESIWEECMQFFSVRDPRQVERGLKDPRDQMALVFRWYLGLSSRWSAMGEAGREMDYQVWCGPAMGAFNDWTRESHLAEAGNRKVAEVNLEILRGAAYLMRVRMVEAMGVRLVEEVRGYRVGR
jgi:PfaD family protein